MNKKPIGVFDSGLGGLTCVKELMRLLPHEDIVYFGDTGRVPYGGRGREIITQYTRQDANFLLSQDVKLIIAACGTASSVVPDLGSYLPVPFTGVVAPTCAAAAAATHNGKIGIIGTSATIKSNSYRRELEKLLPGVNLIEQACPLFVPLVENGFLNPDDDIPRLVAERYLTDLRTAGLDTLILGCTHYPLLSRVLTRVMGENVTLINSGRETAVYAARLLQEEGMLNDQKQEGTARFFVSDSTEGFEQIAALFLGQDMKGSVSRIEIQQF